MIKQILVYEGKHATQYFDASTPEALAASSIELLRQLDGLGYYRIDEEGLVEPEYVDVDTIPEPYKTQAIKDNASKKRRYDSARADNEVTGEIKRILAEDDRSVNTYARGKTYERQVPVAYEALEYRSGGEYENVRLDSMWTEDTEPASS